jgi:hypothetical protein
MRIQIQTAIECGSGSEPLVRVSDPETIRIVSVFDGRLDPDPNPGLKAKMKGENASKRQIIKHKKYKSNIPVINRYCIQMVKCDFILIKILHLKG